MFLDDGTEKSRMSIIEETSSSRLSLERIERSLRFIDPVFLNTPQFKSDSLSRKPSWSWCLKLKL